MSPPDTKPIVVDRRQPWRGLDFYREVDSELFFGREKETLDLLRLVRREVLTVLFGPSGTGKTSLLNAGLFPKLRESSFLPVAIRLDHSSDHPDYMGQVRALIAKALHGDIEHPMEEEPLAPKQAEQESLWEYLHRVVFWDWRNNLITPVLIFDQFEEIFTLGQNRAATEEFLRQVADLTENYIPGQVRSRMEAGETILFPHDQPKSKVILSLREDFVARLDGLRHLMPSVMHNRFSIARMNGEQALLAVQRPGRGIVEDRVAEQIVRFVAAANYSDGTEGEDLPFDRLLVDPALLSVVCRELNALRIAQEKKQITGDLLEQAGTNILDDFYERGFENLQGDVRVFVEDRLLTASGFRSTVPQEEAFQAGIPPEHIRTLVDRRLIRVEERLGIPHLELTHDLLTKVVQKSRDLRQERKRAEREKEGRETEERQRAEQEERRQAKLRADAMETSARRLRRVLAALTAILGLAIVALVYAFAQRQRAEHQTQLAERNAAEAKTAGVVALEEAKKAKQAQFALVQSGRAFLSESPSQTPPGTQPTPIPRIEHIIVLMMENRSFDHMLGSLKAVDGRIDGLNGDESNPDTAGGNAKVQPSAQFQGQLEPDPDHYFPAVDLQIFAGDISPDRVPNMRGFVKSYYDQRPDVAHSRKIMYYFKKSQLPVLTTLALEFAVFNRWFSSVPGPSIPNRAFAHYGTSFGHVDMNSFEAAPPYKSIYERMKEKGHTAKVYYFDTRGSTLEVPNLIQGHPEFFGTFEQFLDDTNKGNLPEYSFIEPNFTDHVSDTGVQVANDQHPDHDVRAGEIFIGTVYQSIKNNPQLWQTSVLLITYSNHGGLFDHVPPPATTPDIFVAQAEQTNTGRAFSFDRLGVRVPAVMVSPWIPKGTVINRVFDHASIPATVTKFFLGDYSPRSPREINADVFIEPKGAALNPRHNILSLKTMRMDCPDFDL